MYHYNGHKWNRVSVNYKHGSLLRIKRGRKTSDNYYLWGVWIDNIIGDSTKLLEYNGGKNLKELSKSVFGNGKWQFVQEIDDEIIFTIDNSLYTYNSNKLEHFITNNLPNSFQNIYGRNKKDIFWLMRDGITHFNGHDIQYILNFYSAQSLSDGILFDEHVFFLAKDINNGLSIIYRGILKK